MQERPWPFAHQQLLAPLEPDEKALVALFQSNLDESMLREIAEADHGWMADECYALLRTALTTGVAAPDLSNIREVLELVRWSEPDDMNWKPGGYGLRGHWMRLFACSELIRLAPKYPGHWSECDTFAQFVSSAVEPGMNAARQAASLLSWRFLTYPGAEEDRAFLAFAILLLAVQLERRQERGQWLKSLATWVAEEESLARKANEWRSHSPGWDEWLFGLTVYRQRESVWRSLAHRILAQPEAAHLHDADEDLRLIGELAART